MSEVAVIPQLLGVAEDPLTLAKATNVADEEICFENFVQISVREAPGAISP